MKAIILGESGVGKSSLLHSYFGEQYGGGSTVGGDCRVAHMGDVHVQFWDTAGQERFRTIIKAYYRGTDVAFLVFDMTNPRTFEEMPNWIQRVREYEPDCRLVLVGNKCDAQGRAVRHTDAAEFAFKCGATYFETSATQFTGVRSCFESILRDDAPSARTKPRPHADYVNLNRTSANETSCCF